MNARAAGHAVGSGLLFGLATLGLLGWLATLAGTNECGTAAGLLAARDCGELAGGGGLLLAALGLLEFRTALRHWE